MALYPNCNCSLEQLTCILCKIIGSADLHFEEQSSTNTKCFNSTKYSVQKTTQDSVSLGVNSLYLEKLSYNLKVLHFKVHHGAESSREVIEFPLKLLE